MVCWSRLATKLVRLAWFDGFRGFGALVSWLSWETIWSTTLTPTLHCETRQDQQTNCKITEKHIQEQSRVFWDMLSSSLNCRWCPWAESDMHLIWLMELCHFLKLQLFLLKEERQNYEWSYQISNFTEWSIIKMKLCTFTFP